jgi:hypothetical protein
MELEITPAFPTLIAQLRVPDAEAMNQDLRALILGEEAEYLSLGRSNIGGWHSRPDLLSRSELSVGALTAWISWAVSRMVDATAGPGAFKGTLCVRWQRSEHADYPYGQDRYKPGLFRQRLVGAVRTDRLGAAGSVAFQFLIFADIAPR